MKDPPFFIFILRLVVEGPAVFDFYSKTCSACQEMKPLIDKLEKEFSDIEFKKYDVDTSEGEKMAEQFEVALLPTFIFINDCGEQVSQRIGIISEEEFRKEIDKIAACPT